MIPAILIGFIVILMVLFVLLVVLQQPKHTTESDTILTKDEVQDIHRKNRKEKS